jgi:hypothetical protein
VPIANGGTGATTASSARTNLDVAQAVYAVPSGGIIMWSGSVASIPTGWLLCNGSSGTPDLRDRFLIGAGSTYGVGTSGGSANAIVVNHSHTYANETALMKNGTNATHNHSALDPAGGTYQNVGTNFGADWFTGGYGSTANGTYVTSTANIDHRHDFGGTTDNASGGQSGTNANLPPYYALAFIMKS